MLDGIFFDKLLKKYIKYSLLYFIYKKEPLAQNKEEGRDARGGRLINSYVQSSPCRCTSQLDEEASILVPCQTGECLHPFGSKLQPVPPIKKEEGRKLNKFICKHSRLSRAKISGIPAIGGPNKKIYISIYYYTQLIKIHHTNTIHS